MASVVRVTFSYSPPFLAILQPTTLQYRATDEANPNDAAVLGGPQPSAAAAMYKFDDDGFWMTVRFFLLKL